MLRINKKEIEKMINLFLDHRGMRKSLTKEELFRKWFGEKYDESTADLLYKNRAKWEYLRRMMKWMRRKSPFFPVNRRMGMGFEYYLVTGEDDGHFFNDHLDSIVTGIRKVQDRYRNYLNSTTVRSKVGRKKRGKNARGVYLSPGNKPEERTA